MSAMLRSRPVLRRFVMCALTRSTLPRRLFPSELLRWSSTATTATASSPIPKPDILTAINNLLPAEPEPAAVDEKDPALAFHTLAEHIHPHTLKAITVRPFKHTHMSPVQAQILPMLPTLSLPHTEHPGSGHPRDLLVKAKTGTGKTMAFLVPAIEARIKALGAHSASVAAQRTGVKLSQADQLRAEASFARQNVGCLIISPTRELASQIAVEASNLTVHHPGWQTQILLGGESKSRQLREWRGRKDIVVATPGRILDLLASEPAVADAISTCNLVISIYPHPKIHQTNTPKKQLILDEADTLLDMGFRDDITRLLTYMPPQPQRQTFLFSATVSRAIQQIAQASLSPTHKFVNCVAHDDSPVHAHIPQYHTVLRSGADVLPHVLRLIANDQLAYPGKLSTPAHMQRASTTSAAGKPSASKIIIFLSTTNMVMLFSALLRKSLALLPTPQSHVALFEIHSKRDMKARQRVSQAFRTSAAPSSILVTSDVSARGVDYPGVTRVVQVGCPSGRDVYVHRVGRTGRGASKEGRGDLVLMPWEMNFVRSKLADVGLKPVTQEQTAAELHERALAAGGSRFGTARIAELQTSAVEIATAFANGGSAGGVRYGDNERLDDVRTAFSSQVGFFLGKAGEQGLGIHEVVQGLKTQWVEMWGLDRAPYLSRNLEAMVSGAAASGGSIRYGRNAGNSSFGGGGGYGRNARSGYGGGGGYQGGDRYQQNDTRDSISGHFSSRSSNDNNGYGYPKGARQGRAFSNAGQYAQSRESAWESGGEGAFAARYSSRNGRGEGAYGYNRQLDSSDASLESDSESSFSRPSTSSHKRSSSHSGSYDFRSRGSKASALHASRGSAAYVSGRGRTHGRNAAFGAGARARSEGREDFGFD
ncbi:LOW QUALITY PROTEIN: hypothetical protein CVT25_009944 [Psilocybe cyanescens]|uniref:ATP-dependent RNA helicase n=1 Tax=Psilocybe cyanescens TaxID=93625 RepID=A0A409XCX8_PSICY|nr:LOW QUALITY PROTEIN: hypothetical protein CVT25_009944 [Psilocybe cyanescens]